MSDSLDDSSNRANPQVEELDALPAGTRFGELEILSTLGVGGFGIVYLAQDHALERRVAIKEYMPGQLAKRGDGSLVSVRSGSLLETFDIGRRSFVNEARLLARFDHRSLLKVYRFWEANGTAYMAMPYLEGQTLRQVRQAMTTRPDGAWMLRVLLPLLDGLGILHGASVYHRDIAPDNILLPQGGGDPILLDFGAARRAISDKTQSFTAILKPSYAPIEQYAETAGLRQGPWTDIYALGAVMHYLVLGRTPPPSTARAVHDEYEALAQMDLAGLPPHMLAAIDWALSVKPQDRPQSCAELCAALTGKLSPPVCRAPAPQSCQPDPDSTIVWQQGVSPSSFEETKVQPRSRIDVPVPAPRPAPAPMAAGSLEEKKSGASKLPLILGVAALLLIGGVWAVMRGGGGAEPPRPDTAARLPEPSAAVVAPPTVLAPQAQEVVPSKAAPSPVLQAASSPALAPVAAVVAKPPPRDVQRPGTARIEAPLQTQTQQQPVQKVPESTPVVSHAAPPPQRTALPPQQQSQAAAPVVQQGPQNPRLACGKRIFLAMSRCIDRECQKPEFAGHAECRGLKEIDEQRDRRDGSR